MYIHYIQLVLNTCSLTSWTLCYLNFSLLPVASSVVILVCIEVWYSGFVTTLLSTMFSCSIYTKIPMFPGSDLRGCEVKPMCQKLNGHSLELMFPLMTTVLAPYTAYNHSIFADNGHIVILNSSKGRFYSLLHLVLLNQPETKLNLHIRWALAYFFLLNSLQTVCVSLRYMCEV